MDVDRESVTTFAVFDESDSWFFGSGSRKFREQNLLYSINGLIEGNLPLFTMTMSSKLNTRFVPESEYGEWSRLVALFPDGGIYISQSVQG